MKKKNFFCLFILLCTLYANNSISELLLSAEEFQKREFYEEAIENYNLILKKRNTTQNIRIKVIKSLIEIYDKIKKTANIIKIFTREIKNSKNDKIKLLLAKFFLQN